MQESVKFNAQDNEQSVVSNLAVAITVSAFVLYFTVHFTKNT